MAQPAFGGVGQQLFTQELFSNDYLAVIAEPDEMKTAIDAIGMG